MGRLEGRHAVVTGGGRGIGAAVAERFHLEGAAGVAILDKDADAAERTARTIDPTGRRVLAFACDVASEEQVAVCVERVLARFGAIDVLVNNAAITRDAMFHKMTAEAWDAVIRVDLYGTFHLCRSILPHMRSRRYGRIVNLSSTAAYGNPGQANYAAAKGAVMSLTATLAKESGPRNITVNCVMPGLIRTDLLGTVPQADLDAYLTQIPLRRFGEPEEVARVIAFLASDEAGYVTGQCLRVNGGFR